MLLSTLANYLVAGGGPGTPGPRWGDIVMAAQPGMGCRAEDVAVSWLAGWRLPGTEVCLMSPVGNGDLLLIRELVAGVAGVVVAGLLTVVVFPSGERAGRVLIMAVACGVTGALVRGWRVGVAVAAFAGFVFIGVIGNEPAMVGGPRPWSYLPILGLAVMLGRGYRSLRQAAGPDLPAE
jgi:hypothetical protein